MDFNKTYDFMRGETYTIKTIPFNSILESVDSYPGVYSWYVRPKPKRESEIVPLLDQLLQQTRLKAVLTGNLRLSYEGSLEKSKIDADVSNLEMLRNVFILAPYPLYIGISTDLKVRLSTHVRQLNQLAESGDILANTEIGELDTDQESSYFASRLTSIFTGAGIKALDSLYIRVYEYRELGLTDNISLEKMRKIKRELEQVERVSNSVFNPVFGRR